MQVCTPVCFPSVMYKCVYLCFPSAAYKYAHLCIFLVLSTCVRTCIFLVLHASTYTCHTPMCFLNVTCKYTHLCVFQVLHASTYTYVFSVLHTGTQPVHIHFPSATVYAHFVSLMLHASSYTCVLFCFSTITDCMVVSVWSSCLCMTPDVCFTEGITFAGVTQIACATTESDTDAALILHEHYDPHRQTAQEKGQTKLINVRHLLGVEGLKKKAIFRIAKCMLK